MFNRVKNDKLYAFTFSFVRKIGLIKKMCGIFIALMMLEYTSKTAQLLTLIWKIIIFYFLIISYTKKLQIKVLELKILHQINEQN